jgi:hypothetical protein
MKQYVIDEIRLQDYGKIKAYLDDTLGESGIDGLYWLPVDESVLSEIQKAHAACAPFFMGLELGEDRLCGELLVRTRKRVRCDCIHYADDRQRDWLIRTVDAIFEKLEIVT